MVKSYTRYEQTQAYGLVNSASANVVWAQDDFSRLSGAGKAIVGANEEVLCWDVKKGELLSRWKDSKCGYEVTAIAQSGADKDVYAVGYEDGSIRVWDSRTHTIIISFNGHKSAITSLTFDSSGARLASGAKDTDIILWDLVAEVGLFKLRGHKDQIVDIQFLKVGPGYTNEETDDEAAANSDTGDNFLLAASKDALLKIWDLSSQHCIETRVAQTNGECWSMGLSPDGSGCITAGNDGELKVWSVDQEGLRSSASQLGDSQEHHYLHDRGIIYRQGKDKTTGIKFHPRSDYVTIHGSDKAVEIWRIRSGEEVKRSLARKRRRKREKAAAAGDQNGDVEMDEDGPPDDISNADVGEVFVPHVIVRTGGKVRSVDWSTSRASKLLQLLIATTNNLLEVYNISPKEKSKKSSSADQTPDYNRSFSVDLPGHRTDVRSLAISSDDRMLASASSGLLKIWNVRTGSCLRTLECGYALCCSFLPGDKIVVVGTKAGDLELFDVASSTLIESFSAHEGAIWTLQVHPDGRSLCTGSADKSAKFWDFKVVQEEVLGTTRTTTKLKLVHTRTLKVTDDILCLRFTPDGRLISISTLDNTVKVFFVDSLKLFLNLYGHKLPVLSISISSDSKVLASSSADKNIRLWGLDFGDCHKALFGHNDSIMQVAFIADPQLEEAHTLFSASKDRVMKTWDARKFVQVQKLPGHHGEIWAMAVARNGDFAVTASHDKSIRVWNAVVDDPIFLEEEREREMEELYESTLTTSLGADNDAEGDGAGENEEKQEVGAASKQTITTLTAGERIMEALELGLEDLDVVGEYKGQVALNPGKKIAPPERDPQYMALGGISAERHVLSVLSSIPAASLQDALLVLPFSTLPALLTFLEIFVERRWNINLATRVLFFVLKTHQKQVVSSRELKARLESIRGAVRKGLGEWRDLVGFNNAALGFLEGRVADSGASRLEDVEELDDEGKGRKKRTFVDVA
ncbi:WD40 repeat-like protein [Aulographum hederae CBS 113979]|uniref:WD40 repeat-like protein n=1 Tax=Aulographum hederae CBS 113979 TaxID=1176131 RepID=A0A6G1HHF1_9PEZI|nr:WD40 repeat-like protein [Aulographum hederae CBS 113979]